MMDSRGEVEKEFEERNFLQKLVLLWWALSHWAAMHKKTLSLAPTQITVVL